MLQSKSKTTPGDTFFGRELAKYGPDRDLDRVWSYEEAAQYCRHFAKNSYENFTVGSWLLPKHLRKDFYNIYAYCRWSDDLADEIPDADTSLRMLDWWQQELLDCQSGKSTHPIMVALNHTITEFALPISPFEDLLSAFRQDQSVQRFQDDSQLLDYCQRSANPVGRILLGLAQAATPSNFELSDKICTALQLANFCQDMERDAGIGRIYAPESLWSSHGVTESMILARKPTPALKRMLRQWVEETRALFDAGKPLAESVPNWLAIDLELFVRGGQTVLHKIQKADFDVWTRRPTVSKADKLLMLGRALLGKLRTSKMRTGRPPRGKPLRGRHVATAEREGSTDA